MDFTKYKRVFAFGCSYTKWYYPTWADLIAKSCVNAEFYNFGKGGGGNTFISSRITQANLKFNFCETDLILVMFSTPFREDRWIDGEWKLHGNIYNQDFYDKKFLKEYTDPVGLIIRDLSVVETTIAYVNGLPCDNIMFRAVDMGHNEFELKYSDHDKYNSRIAEMFNKSSVSKLPALQPIVTKIADKSFSRSKTYKTQYNTTTVDAHPWPIDYLAFLQYVNIPVTQEAIDYAVEATDFIKTVEYMEDLVAKYHSCISNINDEYEIF